MLKFFVIFCLFGILDISQINSKQTLTELIYDNQILEPINLSQLKTSISLNEINNNTQQFTKLQLDNIRLDEDLELLVKQEEEEKQEEKPNKIKQSRKLKPKHQQILNNTLVNAPIQEEQVAVQTTDEQINNNNNNTIVDDSDESNSTGLLSSIFHSVTNYLFENGTGAFFQLKQFNQNSIPPNDQEQEENNTNN